MDLPCHDLCSFSSFVFLRALCGYIRANSLGSRSFAARFYCFSVCLMVSRWQVCCTLEAMKIETKAVHVGHHIEPGTRDVTPAIHLSTTFEKSADGSLPGGYIYSRANNPNRAALEDALASLEEGAAAIAFSSG